MHEHSGKFTPYAHSVCNPKLNSLQYTPTETNECSQQNVLTNDFEQTLKLAETRPRKHVRRKGNLISYTQLLALTPFGEQIDD